MSMEENEERTTTEEDVEGHNSKVRDRPTRNTDDEGDDVEGHGHTHVRGGEDSDDDVEGHAHTTTR